LRAGAWALTAVLAVASAACSGDAAGTASSAEPWGTNTVAPADFVKEIAASNPSKPVIVSTAPPFLFRTGHVPGAVLHGPASSPEGLSSLTAWAQTLPRDTDLVIYCGCCPIDVCPNLRPAYAALKGLGFTKVRVLMLPDSFRADWVERGYPVER
jgi:poly(3-hydroxybutyrate) depolymerase